MKRAAGHDMPPTGWTATRQRGLLLQHPRRGPAAARRPDGARWRDHAALPRGCDPGIQSLAHNLKQDIVVQSPDGATLYKGDGSVVPNASPKDFSGVNSRWPGALWGAGGGTAGLATSPAGP